jgi:hypothetical protein
VRDLGVGVGLLQWRVISWGPNFELPMHNTDTIDLDCVIEGGVELILDNSAHLLGPGDCVVVPGVDHGWRTGEAGCVLAIALFGTPPRSSRGAGGDGATALDLPALARATAAGVDIVQRLGGARVGDRTMVDAMVPAAEALNSAEAQGASLASAREAAAAAANAGASATADLIAKRGRASYVGESARGAADPGAVTIAMSFDAAPRPAAG